MIEIWVLSILLGIAIVLIFAIGGKHQEALDEIDSLKRQSLPCSIRDIEPGRYEIHLLCYHVKNAFGTGTILSADRGVMFIQKGEGIVRAVEFEGNEYVGEAILTSGIRIEVYEENGIKKFKRLTLLSLS